jgi:glutathione synthase/RimK-type ligase-like ATP-grasp enzyme
MKQVIIVGSRNSGSKNNPDDIARFIASNETQVTRVFWEDMIFSVKSGVVTIIANDVDLLSSSTDLVVAVGWYKNGKESIYRDVAFSLALALKHQGITFWNSEMADQRSTTKLSAMVQLALEGIPVPDTLFSIDTNKSLQSNPTYPFVIKAIAASRGESNYLIENEQQLEKANITEGYFLIQPFLANDHDLRVICFGGEPTLVLRRSRRADAETHMNNTSQGGTSAWLDLSSISLELLTLSRKACTIMGREMAGIDLIPDITSSVGYSCLEVNAVPQLSSGTDSDKKLTAFGEAVRNLQGDF